MCSQKCARPFFSDSGIGKEKFKVHRPSKANRMNSGQDFTLYSIACIPET